MVRSPLCQSFLFAHLQSDGLALHRQSYPIGSMPDTRADGIEQPMTSIAEEGSNGIYGEPPTSGFRSRGHSRRGGLRMFYHDVYIKPGGLAPEVY